MDAVGDDTEERGGGTFDAVEEGVTGSVDGIDWVGVSIVGRWELCVCFRSRYKDADRMSRLSLWR